MSEKDFDNGFEKKILIMVLLREIDNYNKAGYIKQNFDKRIATYPLFSILKLNYCFSRIFLNKYK